MSKNNMKSPEEKEIIVKRYLNGESTTKLADEFNVSRRRIYYWVKDYEEKGKENKEKIQSCNLQEQALEKALKEHKALIIDESYFYLKEEK